ncbi:MAG: hypothetical protein CL851_04590 [Crocinitomicaceae bacterium]|nr:hypothetical protein [Crocinitomicaceae bacterium]
MKKILLSFSFIALFGIGVTSLSFEFPDNSSTENEINLYNKEVKVPCCNTKNKSELISDNISEKKERSSKKIF